MLSDHMPDPGKPKITKKNILDYARQLHAPDMEEYERLNPGNKSVRPDWKYINGKWRMAGEFDDIPKRFLDLSNKPNARTIPFAEFDSTITGNVDDVATVAGHTSGDDLREWMRLNRTAPRIKDYLEIAEAHMKSVTNTPIPSIAPLERVAVSGQIESSQSRLTPRDIALHSIGLSSQDEYEALGNKLVAGGAAYPITPVAQTYFGGRKIEGGLAAASRIKPKTRSEDTLYQPKWKIDEADLNTPTVSHSQGGNLAEMRAGGKLTAASILSGQARAGYFVMTDQSRAETWSDVPVTTGPFEEKRLAELRADPAFAARRAMGSRALKNAVYFVQAKKTPQGLFRVLAVPQGIPRDIARENTFYETVDEEKAERLLGAFEKVDETRTFVTPRGTRVIAGSEVSRRLVAIHNTSKVIAHAQEAARVRVGSKIQMDILQHEQVFRSLRYLRDPKEFRAVVQKGGRLRSGYNKSSSIKNNLRNYLGERFANGFDSEGNPRAYKYGSQAITDTFTKTIQPGGTAHEAALSLLERVEQTAQGIYSGTGLGTTFDTPEYEDIFRATWEDAINPIIDAMTSHVVLPMSANQHVGTPVMSGLFKTKSRSVFSQQASTLGVGSNYQVAMQGLIAEYQDNMPAIQREHKRLIKKEEELAKLEKREPREIPAPMSLRKFLSDRSSNPAWIMQRLQALDEEEKRLPNGPHRVTLKGRQISGNRTAQFNRIRNRMEYQRRRTGSSHDILWKFQEAIPGKQGYGIHMSVVPRGQSVIAGLPTASQGFIPIQDMYGRFTNSAGDIEYVGRMFGVSEKVMKYAGLAVWDKNFTLISQGLEPARRIAGFGTTFGKKSVQQMTVFAAGEVMAASIDSRIQAYWKLINKGNYTEGTRMFQNAIFDAIERGAAERVEDRSSRRPDFTLRNEVVMMTDSPLDLLMASPSFDADMVNKIVSLPDSKMRHWAERHPDGSFLPSQSTFKLIDVNKDQTLDEEGKKIKTETMSWMRKHPARGKRKAVKRKITAQLDIDEYLERVVSNSTIRDQIKEKLRDPWRGMIKENYGSTIKTQNDISKYVARALVGNRADAITYSIRERLAYASVIGAIQGIKGTSDMKPVSNVVFKAATPFGWAEERPLQNMSPIELKDVAEEDMTMPLKINGYEDFLSPKTTRKVRGAFMMSAQLLDEQGNVIREIGSEEAMRWAGNSEQQAIFTSEAAKRLFGLEDPNRLINEKTFAASSKNTAQIMGIAESAVWDDPSIDMMVGVDPPKTAGKHGSFAAVFAQGWLNGIMENPGERKEEVREKISRLLGVTVEDTVGGMLSAKIDINARIPNPLEIAEIADIAGYQMSSNTLFKRGNSYMRANVVRVTLPVSIDDDPHTETNLGARERLYGGRRPRKSPRANLIRSNAMNLRRAQGENLLVHVQQVAEGGLAAKIKSGALYAANQLGSAYLGTFGKLNAKGIEENIGSPIQWQKYSELIQRNRHVPLANGRATEAELEERYGSGMRGISDLPPVKIDNKIISKWYLPDEIRPHGRQTKLERLFDRMIYSLHEENWDGSKTWRSSGEYEKRAREYYDYFTSSTMGTKSGILAKVAKDTEIDGIGGMKSEIGQNLWGDHDPITNPRGMKPFEIRIGLDVAESWGAISPQDERVNANGKEIFPWAPRSSVSKKELAKIHDTILGSLDDRGFMSFYAIGGRSPEVTPGRLAMNVTIDPHLPGTSVYYHHSLDDIQIADSDGDKFSAFIAGLINNSRVSHKQFLQGQNAAAQIVEQKREIFKTRELTQFQPDLKPVFVNSNKQVADYITSQLPVQEDGTRYQRRRTAQEVMELVQQRATGNDIGPVGNVIKPIQAWLIEAEEEARNILSRSTDSGEISRALEILGHSTVIRHQVGWFTEDAIKVKSKSEFDMGTVVGAITNRERYNIVNINAQNPVGLPISPWEPKTGTPSAEDLVPGLTVFDPGYTKKATRDDLADLLNKFFISPNNKPGDLKKVQKAEAYDFFRDTLIHQWDKHGDDWYKEIMRPHAGVIDGATGFSTSAFSVKKATQQLLAQMMNQDTDTKFGSSERLLQAMQEAAMGIVKPYLGYAGARNPGAPLDPIEVPEVPEKMPSALAAEAVDVLEKRNTRKLIGLDIPGIIRLTEPLREKYPEGRPEKKYASFTDISSINIKPRDRITSLNAYEFETVDIPRSLVPAAAIGLPSPMDPQYFSKSPMETALDLVETPIPEKIEVPISQRIEEKVIAAAQTSARTSRGKESIWAAVAGLAGGAALVWGSMNSGKKERDQPPDIPKKTEPPRVRVMDGNFGGSHGSYNIQVRANDSQSRNSDEYGLMASQAIPNGNSTVQLQDNRKDIQQQMNQNFIASMKGR